MVSYKSFSFFSLWDFFSERNLSKFNGEGEIKIVFFIDCAIKYNVIIYTSCSFSRSFSFSSEANSVGGGVASKLSCVVSLGITAEEEDCPAEPGCVGLCNGRGANSSGQATYSVLFTWKW